MEAVIEWRKCSSWSEEGGRALHFVGGSEGIDNRSDVGFNSTLYAMSKVTLKNLLMATGLDGTGVTPAMVSRMGVVNAMRWN